MYKFFLAFWLLLIPMQTALAGSTAQGRHYDATIAVQSLSAKPGTALNLALIVTPAPGWHIYWSNPGESGYPPALNWTLPAGITAGAIEHPTPQLMKLGGIASNVHEGETILLQSLQIPSNLKVGHNLDLAVDLDMLVCSDSSCVPDPLHLEITVPVGNGAINPARSALFTRAQAKIPVSLSAGARFHINKDKIRIFIPGITLADGEKAHFFDAKNKVILDDAAQTFTPAKGGLIITVSAGDQPAGLQLSGVLRLDSRDGAVKAYAFDAASATYLPAVIKPEQSGMTANGFLLSFLAAILGGLLLNLMPCVFPILSLKALALARAGGENDHNAKREAIGYAVGATGTILALGATLLFLRSSGQALGWAFQLQDTRVVTLLLLLVTAIATNLAGMYELPTLGSGGQAKSGFAGALSTGALAAFIATPCTGPFMAGALGAALLLPVPAALAIFFGLGLGLSLPFLALGFIKPMRGWLPKPGAWMQKLRQILSIPMFATALGLVWIVGREADVNLMTKALGAALLLALGLWWYGLRQFSEKKIWPVFIPILLALTLSVTLVRANPSMDGVTAGQKTPDLLGAEPFSKSRLNDLRAAHTPVFVYMTADWCLSCKVNEATSLTSSTVATAFRNAGVVVLRGDWTTGDKKITAFLKEMGSAGVPLYLWYPKNGKVRQLPQILTPSMLTGLVKAANP